MKCITVLEPYALLITLGLKPWENRSWPTSYRGPLLIHAGVSRKMLDTLSDPEADDLIAWCRANGVKDLNSMLRFGQITGIVDVTGCKSWGDARRADPAKEHYAHGPWCHRYDRAARFARGIPYRGQLGIFDVPDEMVAGAIAEVKP